MPIRPYVNTLLSHFFHWRKMFSVTGKYCMQVTKQLLRKYIDGDCSAEEEQLVMNELTDNTALAEQLNALLDESWDDASQHHTPDIAADRVHASLRHQLYPDHQRSVRWRRLWRSAAAAALLIILLSTWMFQKQSGDVIASNENADKYRVIEHLENHELVNQTYTLPDRSLATLKPGSSLDYEKDFAAGRYLELKGEGFFDVQKDTAHPFTVQAGTLAVTALGTSFRVSDLADPGHIMVQLYTGKVKLTQPAMAKAFKPVILTPGQQWTFDPVLHDGVLASIQPSGKISPLGKTSTTVLPKQGPADDGSWSFESRPLVEVMSILQARYHRPIRYNPDHLSGKYFTGTLSPKDSLPLILTSIAALNGLQVSVTDSVAVIEKNP